MKTVVKVVAGLLTLVIITGCGGGISQRSTTTRREPPRIRGTSFPQRLQPASQARAEEFKYHNWRAYRLTNGLVTVVAVPAIGGRIMEYKLGDKPLLWVNPAELGKVYEPPSSEEDRVFHNYGGYKVWPAPQARWAGPPDPLGSQLTGGQWSGQITAAQGQSVEIEMVSPEDKKVTGLQITRRVKLFAGTTRVAITEIFKNITDQPITWSIWDVTQVPGSLSRASKYNEQSRIYFPLNPDSRYEQGFWPLHEGGESQFQVIDEGKLMQVSYHNEEGKIGADSVAGWIAHVDEINEYAYIKSFPVHQLADYPDDGATVEVWTNGGDLSYMEMEVLSPLHTLQPGEQFSFTEEWYTTQIGGPLREVTELAAIRQPLQLEYSEGEIQKLTGELGVFAPGKLKIAFVNQADQPLSEPIIKQVNPTEAVVLNQSLATAPGAATKLTLTLENEYGTDLGVVAQLPLDVRVAHTD